MKLFDEVSVDDNLKSVFEVPLNGTKPSSPILDTKVNTEEADTAEVEPTNEPAKAETAEVDTAKADTAKAETPKAETAEAESAPQIDESEQTIFVKNVPNAVITDRKIANQFKSLFKPGVKSMRFRSIAMSEMLPRKVAYIKKLLHPARDAVNSYVVFESKDRAFEVLNKFKVIEFKDHHMFVDSVKTSRFQNSKATVFIGNLPFEATEEQLYLHFQDCGTIENVRIVRDRQFNLGKGFAYIQFEDVSEVQVALMKNDTIFMNRKLRVTKCTTKQRHAKTDKSFKQKTTPRSERRKEQRKQTMKKLGKSENEVKEKKPEGLRAKMGDQVSLQRKRKPRSPFGRNAKRQKA